MSLTSAPLSLHLPVATNRCTDGTHWDQATKPLKNTHRPSWPQILLPRFFPQCSLLLQGLPGCPHFALLFCLAEDPSSMSLSCTSSSNSSQVTATELSPSTCGLPTPFCSRALQLPGPGSASHDLPLIHMARPVPGLGFQGHLSPRLSTSLTTCCSSHCWPFGCSQSFPSDPPLYLPPTGSFL